MASVTSPPSTKLLLTMVDVMRTRLFALQLQEAAATLPTLFVPTALPTADDKRRPPIPLSEAEKKARRVLDDVAGFFQRRALAA